MEQRFNFIRNPAASELSSSDGRLILRHKRRDRSGVEHFDAIIDGLSYTFQATPLLVDDASKVVWSVRMLGKSFMGNDVGAYAVLDDPGRRELKFRVEDLLKAWGFSLDENPMPVQVEFKDK